MLVLHFKRFIYDAAADGMVKINKSIRFAPELEIPLGKVFSFLPPREVLILLVQISRYRRSRHATYSMACFTTMV
jgi:hypothetical protein